MNNNKDVAAVGVLLVGETESPHANQQLASSCHYETLLQQTPNETLFIKLYTLHSRPKDLNLKLRTLNLHPNPQSLNPGAERSPQLRCWLTQGEQRGRRVAPRESQKPK